MRTIVLSLGGSLVVPKDIDADFLKRFRQLVLKHLGNKRFIIIVGGGFTARKYQQASEDIAGAGDDERDWMGILATKMNAYLLKIVFKEHAYHKVLADPTKKTGFKGILVASGWKPGFSTDYDAVLWAKNYGAEVIVNLTDVDFVYNKDPKKFRDAKPVERLSWGEYKNIIGGEWKPGLKSPFDPVASREAEKSGLKVLVLNGRELDNLDRFLKGEKFRGSVISG
jgi:uridylate kinase